MIWALFFKTRGSSDFDENWHGVSLGGKNKHFLLFLEKLLKLPILQGLKFGNSFKSYIFVSLISLLELH
jgi:hypothetical protein